MSSSDVMRHPDDQNSCYNVQESSKCKTFFNVSMHTQNTNVHLNI